MTIGFFARRLDDLMQMLGRAPRRVGKADKSAEALALEAFKRTPAERRRRLDAIRAEEAEGSVSHKWRIRRWASILAVNGLFVASFWVDLQLVEGALTASRVLGFHFADLNSSLQLMLAHGHVVLNLLIGVTTVLLLYLLFGGRAFCSWVCPYHLVSEIAEMVHLKLAARGIVTDHDLDRRLRPVMFVVFAGLAFGSGYTLFETISPVGILSRAMTYGTVTALLWIGVLLLVEVFWSRRFWCRYVCPIGLTYGFVGLATPVRVLWDSEKCLHEGKCRQVCLVPHVLETTKLGRASDVRSPIGADCTRCAMCLDVCPSGALSFDVVGITRRPPPGVPGQSKTEDA
jgi:ferredoxin-type protein NapH